MAAARQSGVDEPKYIVQNVVAAGVRNEVKRLRVALRVLASVNLYYDERSITITYVVRVRRFSGLCNPSYRACSTGSRGHGVPRGLFHVKMQGTHQKFARNKHNDVSTRSCGLCIKSGDSVRNFLER